MQQRIEEVDREARPKPIIINKTTGKVHRVLTTMLDTGGEAVARCGFKYAYCPKTFHDSIPEGTTKKKVCGTCFRDERVNMD